MGRCPSSSPVSLWRASAVAHRPHPGRFGPGGVAPGRGPAPSHASCRLRGDDRGGDDRHRQIVRTRRSQYADGAGGAASWGCGGYLAATAGGAGAYPHEDVVMVGTHRLPTGGPARGATERKPGRVLMRTPALLISILALFPPVRSPPGNPPSGSSPPASRCDAARPPDQRQQPGVRTRRPALRPRLRRPHPRACSTPTATAWRTGPSRSGTGPRSVRRWRWPGGPRASTSRRTARSRC